MAEVAEILDEEIVQPPATPEESSAFFSKLLLLKARCATASIEFEQKTDEEGDPYATISIQSGAAKRKVTVFHESKADALLSIPFEKYNFLAGFEAICSYGDRLIEVGVTGNHAPSGLLFERLRNATSSVAPEATTIELLPPETMPGRPKIEIGPCSDDFEAFFGKRRMMSDRLGLTMKLRGTRAIQHDQALSELRSYADSVFFQIDMICGASFVLQRERRIRFIPARRKPIAAQLEYPLAHYNGEAISLYWYAKSAQNMPLLRFLAFYQSVEYFFPRYSQTEARKRVSAVVKNPTFRPYKDDDLDRLISAIQFGRGGGIGTERSQLRAAVNECVGADDIRQFLSSPPERVAYFSGKSPNHHRIPVANKAADLRNDVADRIYSIRCKIVHTKNEHSEDDVSMILPFSEDADQLVHDIDLVEFVARRVLVSSSSELT